MQTHAREFQFLSTVHVGMGDVDAVVEDGRFTEDHVSHPRLVVLLGVFAALEPHEVGNARAVSEMGDDTFLARTHLEGFETQDMSHDLHEGHIPRQFVDGVYFRTVDILIGIVLEQVAIGVDAELVAQNLLPVGTHPRQVLYVLFEDVHQISTSAIFRS